MELTDEMIKQIIKEIRLYEVQKRMVEWELKEEKNELESLNS